MGITSNELVAKQGLQNDSQSTEKVQTYERANADKEFNFES